MKGYLECRGLSWRSITSGTLLSEVGVCVFVRLTSIHSAPLHGALIMWGSVPWASPAGEDPLAEGSYDLDSVAGVLKLYFRGLDNPLFPLDSTNLLLEHARECSCAPVDIISVAKDAQQQLLFYFITFLFSRNKE